ncbi:hypothetical protein [Erythrobacter longus]|uniref:hypothetical protein n=1 Tax=Erythrobacter longus TaxID=1044 RepID=UPI001F517FA0|nr:hypothetical protein [Erythrobacter longus]
MDRRDRLHFQASWQDIERGMEKVDTAQINDLRQPPHGCWAVGRTFDDDLRYIWGGGERFLALRVLEKKEPPIRREYWQMTH